VTGVTIGKFGAIAGFFAPDRGAAESHG